jgi:hypothetical protein
METIWAITAAVVPVAIAIGVALMIPADRGFRIAARLCFVFSGAWLGVVGFMWLIHTPSTLTYRIIAGLAIGAFVFVVVPMLIRVAWPVSEAQTVASPVEPPSVFGPGNFSIDQKGGTVNQNYINQAPPPELRYVRSEQQRELDGSYISKIFVDLVAPYPPSGIYFEVHANYVKELDIIPQFKSSSGIVFRGASGNRPGYSFTTIQTPPPGILMLSVRTATNPGKIGGPHGFGSHLRPNTGNFVGSGLGRASTTVKKLTGS